MDKENNSQLLSGHELGYADSSEGVHIKLKVIEHFMKSDRFLILHMMKNPLHLQKRSLRQTLPSPTQFINKLIKTS